ncbi:MAG: hypothetical protein PHV37_06395 [Candidatus Gastranaerophilales bacterium]|nr:hypothetical protein [Candidatus Gastranaerophilales bacterium]
MPQPYAQPPQFKTRIAVLLFIKGSAAPMVLYFEDPIAIYNELMQLMKTSAAMSKLYEKDAIGPIRRFCISSNQIAGVALQEEQIPA